MYPTSRPLVQIKKYPNRRFYDATNSRHVTLQDVHDLILSGSDVAVTDSRNDEDITNLILTQLILEQDEPKLSLLPSSVLHFVIRSNRQVLTQWFEKIFGPFASIMASSQRQIDTFVREAMSSIPNPLQWAEFFQAYRPATGKQPRATASPEEADVVQPDQQAEIDELRRKLATLEKRLDELNRPTNYDL